MAEEKERGPIDPAAAAFALGAANDPAMQEDVRAYLRRQAELAALQIEDMKREDAVRHWSLRIHHVSDVLKLGFELAAAILITVIVVFIGAAVWDAAHDDGLVIESFNVPADMAANGLSGQVIATQVQDRLAWMQAHTDTIRQADSYRSAFGDDIKVQIPDTGVSIGEFYRYLASWLGHQKHITGEIWRGPNGLSLGVRSSAESAAVFTAKESELSSLIDKAAERIYWQTQPYRYAVFLESHDRNAEGRAAVAKLIAAGTLDDKAWGYSRLGLDAMVDGDFRAARALHEKGIAANPKLPHIWDNLAAAESYFGHAEAMLRDLRKAEALSEDPDSARQLAPYALAVEALTTRLAGVELLGDYQEAMVVEKKLAAKPVYSGSNAVSADAMREDLILDHDLAPVLAAGDGGRAFEAAAIHDFAAIGVAAETPSLPAYDLAVERGDWRAARNDLRWVMQQPDAKLPLLTALVPVFIWPRQALTDAMTGDFVDADALIAKTPRDCYVCVVARARIADAEGKRDEAARWFAQALRQAPSIPLAETEWGAMLLRHGGCDAAIAKFKAAHTKAPHFADPLEMWGEALMLQNRSDLARPKFEEAAKYAPNWGRLHLKWGEALWWSGDKAGAGKQFAVAATFGLTAAEKAELTRVRHG